MAARAARVVLSRRHGVLTDEVVGVDLTRPHVAVVAAHAEAFLVAIGAKLAVVTGNALVPLDEVWTVTGVVEPRWRQ